MLVSALRGESVRSSLAARAAVLAAAAVLLCGCAVTRWVGLGPDLDPDEPLSTDSAEVLYDKGRRLFAAERWDESGDAFGRVWKDHPNSPLASDARFYEAECRLGMEKYNGAFELYKAFLAENPLSPHAPLIQRRLYEMGCWTIVEGSRGVLGIFDYSSEGVDMLEYLVNAFPNGDLADDALIYVADFEAASRRPQDAVYHLHDLVDRYPGSEWALEGRLRLARAYRDLNRGLDYDADALKRSAAQYRAYIEIVTAERDRAREYAEVLAQARLELGEVEEFLARKGLSAADFYLYAGKTEAARQELRNVIRVFPASGAADEARRRLGGPVAAAPAPAPKPPEPAPEPPPVAPEPPSVAPETPAEGPVAPPDEPEAPPVSPTPPGEAPK